MDLLAKSAVEEHRVPRTVRKAIRDQERSVSHMARWVARVTAAANSWGPRGLRDTESAPRARAHGAAAGTRKPK